MEWGMGGLVATSCAVYRPYLPCGVGWYEPMPCQAYDTLKTPKAVVYYVSGVTLCAS